MWMDIDPEAAVVKGRIAEAYREAERRGLARQAKSANRADTRRAPLRLHIVQAAARLWPKRRIEKPALP